MYNKIKCESLPSYITHEELIEDGLTIVENPTNYNKIKDGRYLVRGDKKKFDKRYYVIDNNWYLIDENNGTASYSIRAATYNYVPYMTEREYNYLVKVSDKLNNYWRMALSSRRALDDTRQILRVINAMQWNLYLNL